MGKPFTAQNLETCLFCKIAQKAIPTDIIYEDSTITSFYDIAPQAPTHLLIIPKTHVENLHELISHDQTVSSNLTFQLFTVINKLIKKFNLAQSGYRIVMNNGETAGQSIFHAHVHLLSGRAFQWPPG